MKIKYVIPALIASLFSLPAIADDYDYFANNTDQTIVAHYYYCSSFHDGTFDINTCNFGKPRHIDLLPGEVRKVKVENGNLGYIAVGGVTDVRGEDVAGWRTLADCKMLGRDATGIFTSRTASFGTVGLATDSCTISPV